MGENALVRAVMDPSRGKTVVLITHRTSIINAVDNRCDAKAEMVAYGLRDQVLAHLMQQQQGQCKGRSLGKPRPKQAAHAQQQSAPAPACAGHPSGTKPCRRVTRI